MYTRTQFDIRIHIIYSREIHSDTKKNIMKRSTT